MTRGMVLGKFMPPHAGHVYLVEFARRFADDVSVVVGTLAAEPIAGELRYQWMRELFPDLRVIHLTDENPQHPGEHPDFWQIWRRSLERVLPARPELVFASEAYGPKLAEVLGARFVPVDAGREALPVSGTALRDDPFRHWAFLPRCVRPYFAKRVSIFGPESTGKTTLARALARRFGTVAAPEYARAWLEARGGKVGPEDMEPICRGQIASEDALALEATRLLVCDTDPLATVVWSEALFGACPPAVEEKALARRYDLTILLDVDVPWVEDPVRYLPAARRSFFERCERALARAGRPFVTVRGDWGARLEQAERAVRSIFPPGAFA
ncbi:MAG TPA: AAA family ATPase [Polyangiaceae bacterium]|nr:AAA family ATPase [Polyangiaceae bacterium]